MRNNHIKQWSQVKNYGTSGTRSIWTAFVRRILIMKFCFTSRTLCVYSLNQYFPRGGQPIKSNSATAHHISLIANMTGRSTTNLRHAEPSLTHTLSISCRTFTLTPSTHIRRQVQYRYRAKAYVCRYFEPFSFQPVHDAITSLFAERVRVINLFFTCINWQN